MAIERKSKQRDAILNNLKSRYDHPTAMDLFLSVREEIPNISLGTLYRNLSQLEECGMIIKIPDGGVDRFDGNPTPHVHFKCQCCKNVYDITDFDDNLLFNDKNIGQIYGYSLMLFGRCTTCENAVKI